MPQLARASLGVIKHCGHLAREYPPPRPSPMGTPLSRGGEGRGWTAQLRRELPWLVERPWEF
eukprot:5473267-Alexandrium_andersonii.AAC.1